jgi:hypothetical protein
VRPYLKKPFTKIGVVEWLQVYALSSSPSTAKKKKKKSCFPRSILEASTTLKKCGNAHALSSPRWPGFNKGFTEYRKDFKTGVTAYQYGTHI